MKKQSKSDKAFIDKIKTIGINTGSGKTCQYCHKEIQPGEFHKVADFDITIAIPKRKVTAPDTSAENSFAA